MSTQVAYGIGIVLYLLSCWRAWNRITRPDRRTLKSSYSTTQKSHHAVPVDRDRPSVASMSTTQNVQSPDHSGDRKIPHS